MKFITSFKNLLLISEAIIFSYAQITTDIYEEGYKNGYGIELTNDESKYPIYEKCYLPSVNGIIVESGCSNVTSTECQEVYKNPKNYINSPTGKGDSDEGKLLSELYFNFYSFLGSYQTMICSNEKECKIVKKLRERNRDEPGYIAIHFPNVNKRFNSLVYNNKLTVESTSDPFFEFDPKDLKNTCKTKECLDNAIEMYEKAVQFENLCIEYENFKNSDGTTTTAKDYPIIEATQNTLNKLQTECSHAVSIIANKYLIAIASLFFIYFNI